MLSLPIWNFSFYHLFLSIEKNKEVATEPILSLLQGKDKNVVVPKMISATELHHFLLTDDTRFRLNKWAIPEPENGIPISPEQLDVIFVPLLAFDRNGHRVGYGKGYYDTFIANCKADVITIGLSFFDPVPKIEDVGDHDIPLNYVVTPEKTYSF